MTVRILLALLLIASAPAALAADYAVLDGKAWLDRKNKPPRPRLAEIGIPREAATVRLSKLDGFRPGGEDNVAQYLSADGNVFATLYIYRPTLPDARLAAIATGEAITQRLDKRLRRLPDAVMAAGGRPGVAYRTMLDEASFPADANTSLGYQASFAAFVQAGTWLVKLRVTGPEPRKAEVEAVGAAILAGLSFGKREQPLTATPYTLAECIDETINPAAQRLAGASDQTMTALLSTGTLLTPANIGDAGNAPLCVMRRGMAGRAIRLILRRADKGADPAYMLLGDAGTIIQVADLSLDGRPRPGVVVHGVGGAQVFGPFDRAPTADQLAGILGGNDAWLGAPVAQLSYGAKDKLTVSINMPAAPSGR